MNTREKLYQKTWFKNTILISIPTLISTMGAIISLVTISETIKHIVIFVIVILMIILIVAVFVFSSQDDKIYEAYKEELIKNQTLLATMALLENDLKTSNSIIETFSEFSEKWSKNINSFATNVINKNTVSDKAWDKIKYYDAICAQCKNMIKQRCKYSDDSKISVSFTSYWEDENGDKYIHMVSHSSPESIRPKACKHPEKLNDSKYHYAQLIKDEYSDIEVAVNNEEILRIFQRVTTNTDLSKYTQYIAIPVYCTSNKLLGIFQIITKYNCIIEDNNVSLRKFAQEKLIPYSNLIVLVDKISKGLYVTPQQIQKEV